MTIGSIGGSDLGFLRLILGNEVLTQKWCGDREFHHAAAWREPGCVLERNLNSTSKTVATVCVVANRCFQQVGNDILVVAGDALALWWAITAMGLSLRSGGWRDVPDGNARWVSFIPSKWMPKGGHLTV